MKLSLSSPSEIHALIDERVKSGKYPSAEDVVAAAVSTLDQQERFGEFEPGELDALLLEGEQDIAAGRFVEGKKVFEELRKRSAERRSKAQ